MKITMNISHINTVVQMQNFLNSIEKIDLNIFSKKELYDYLLTVLVKIKYRKLRKTDTTSHGGWGNSYWWKRIISKDGEKKEEIWKSYYRTRPKKKVVEAETL